MPREEFEIDPGLRAMIAEEMAQKEEAARKELAWENEKARLMLAKVGGVAECAALIRCPDPRSVQARKWFLDDVEVERIVLYGFLNRKSVTSFRTRKLSEELQLEIARVHNILAEEKENGANRGLMQDDGDEDRGGRRVREAGIGPAAGKSSTSLALEEELEGKKLTKADLRRIARRKREAEWEAFNATKPDKDKENPDDVDAIREAEANMGDFKLKSDPNYVVPEGERMNKEKKRRQMILLEEGMYNIRMEFNRRFLALRDVKKKVCQSARTISALHTRVG